MTKFMHIFDVYNVLMISGSFGVMSCYKSRFSGKLVNSAPKGHAEKGVFGTRSILTHFGSNGSRILGNKV